MFSSILLQRMTVDKLRGRVVKIAVLTTLVWTSRKKKAIGLDPAHAGGRSENYAAPSLTRASATSNPVYYQH